MTTTQVDVTIHGERDNGEPYSDTVVLTPEEWKQILDLLHNKVENRRKRPGGFTILNSNDPTLQNHPARKALELLVRIDI